MTSPQFIWRLSHGVRVLAVAGTFWLGLGLGPYTWKIGVGVWLVFIAILIGCCVAIFCAAIQLGRRARFNASDLDRLDSASAIAIRRIRNRFRWIGILQTAAAIAVVAFCVSVRRQDLISPLIAIVVSVHFAPLGHLFHVRAYYLTAIAGTVVSLMALSQTRLDPQLVVGTGMAFVIWISACYLVWNANRIAARAVQERWA